MSRIWLYFNITLMLICFTSWFGVILRRYYIKQDHCRGVYLPPSINGEEIPFLRYSQFFIVRWNPRRPPKVAKTEIFPLGTEYCCTTLQVQNSLKIALSLTISKIFSMFCFPLKCKMAPKSGENWNFSPLHRTLLYYPAGQKFARNRSILYGVWDIHTFSLCVKI